MRIFVVRCNKLCIWFVSRVVRITSFIRFLKKMLHINTLQMSFVTQSGIIKYIYFFSSPIFSRTQLSSSPLRLNVPIHVWITRSWKLFNRASPKIRNIKFTEPSEFRLLWRYTIEEKTTLGPSLRSSPRSSGGSINFSSRRDPRSGQEVVSSKRREARTSRRKKKKERRG